MLIKKNFTIQLADNILCYRVYWKYKLSQPWENAYFLVILCPFAKNETDMNFFKRWAFNIYLVLY